MVSIGITMNQQINLRLPEKLLNYAINYAKKNGFATVQELIKESLRERLFPEKTISQKELKLVKKLILISEQKGLYGTEEELFQILNK